MIIARSDRKISGVMNLEDGDIFTYAGNYYIASNINFVDNYRECFNLTHNCISKVSHNPIVEYWHGDNVTLNLCDDKE